MQNEKILAVDDDKDLLSLINLSLSREGFSVQTLTGGSNAAQTAAETKPSLIILDLILPDKDGFEVLKELQGNSATKHIPVIILSASAEADDVVKGLELGADDYMIKPFNKSVLAARVRSVMRRRGLDKQVQQEVLQLDMLSIDPMRHEVKIDSKVVDLTVGEFKLLHFLAQKKGAVFTRSQIIEKMHGPDYGITNRSVDVQLVGIRKKLGHYGKYLQTVRGVGYRFKD